MTLRLLCWCVAVLIGLYGSVFAQSSAPSWPTKPIRVIIPFGAGSATDIIPRIVFEPLSAQLGQPIVVENRVGAGGTLGVTAVAKAEPDGHTLLAHSNAHTISPAIYSKLSYDPAGDFAGITPFGAVPNVLIISPSKGIKTIQELVAAAKAKPGTFNYASVGVGSGTHFSVEKFKLSSGLDAQHIPLQGRAGGADRCDRRPRRFLFLPDQHRAAAHSRGQTDCAGDKCHRAFARTARRADHGRSGL